jgi:hypothetical protein
MQAGQTWPADTTFEAHRHKPSFNSLIHGAVHEGLVVCAVASRV